MDVQVVVAYFKAAPLHLFQVSTKVVQDGFPTEHFRTQTRVLTAPYFTKRRSLNCTSYTHGVSIPQGHLPQRKTAPADRNITLRDISVHDGLHIAGDRSCRAMGQDKMDTCVRVCGVCSSCPPQHRCWGSKVGLKATRPAKFVQ